MAGISFNLIPSDILVPGQYIEIDNSKALSGLVGMPTKILVIGQKLASGVQAPLEPVLVTRPDQARQMFGIGAQITHMLERVLSVDGLIPVYAIAQEDDAAGVAATGAITFAGPATAAGTVNLWIGGRRIRVAVAAAQTAAQIATAIAATINAETDLVVTAAVDGVDTSKVNLTAKNKGECANDVDIRFNYYQDERFPSGITATITAMSGGSGNPDVDDVINVIGDEWYTDFIMAYTDSANIVLMETELADRFGPLRMTDGHLFAGLSGTHAALVTKSSARNSPHLSWMGVKKPPNPPYEWAATLGAVASYQGKIDPARPLGSLTLPGLLAPSIEDQFTLEERNILLANGVSTFRVTSGAIVIERVVTTYHQNSFGAADRSYLDVESLKTLSFIRYDTRTFIAVTYPRHKLADDGTNFARGQAVVTPSVIRGSLIARARLWEENGLAENIDQFIQDLIVERDTTDRSRVNSLIPIDIINGFRVFAANQQFRL